MELDLKVRQVNKYSMKIPALLIIVAAGLGGVTEAAAQEVRDVRIVNGVKVDLSPIVKWFETKEGDRPMKHWRRLQVLEVKGKVGVWMKCLVKTESGARVELFVANLPPEILAVFQKLDGQYQEIVRLRVAVETDSQKLREANARTPTGPVVSAEYVDTALSRRRAVDLWTSNLELDRTKLAKLEAEYHADLEKAGEQTSVLAMATGKQYTKIDIWDCGVKQ